MDYPHANVGHHHHNHNRRDDDDDMYNPPPPPQPPAPPPPHLNPAYPQPAAAAYNQYPPPPHVGGSHHYPPPGVPSHSSHTPHVGGPELGLGHLLNRPSHKIHCKAGGERFAVGIRDHKLVLTHPDHSDPTQHWYKDEKYSTKVKDKEGHPCFILVNKATGQAVKHSISCHPVQLAPYKPDVLDESVLWTESKDLGSGFRTIRTVNNIHLLMDAWNADKDHGGIHDGTLIALYETWKGDNQNQQWKFAHHSTHDQQPPSPRGYNTTHPPYVKYQNYPPPSTPPPTSYVIHEDNNPHFKPHAPDFIEEYFNNQKPNYTNNVNNAANNKINNYVSDGVGLVGPNMGFLANKPTYKIYSKAGGEKFAVTIRDGKVVLTHPNSYDPAQKWYKDERYSTKVKDEEHHPSFILVNKATAQAVKHSIAGYPVQLTPYNPEALDESIMWTESKDLGSGFRTIRTVNNVGLVMDAWNADKDHGGIRDGTVVALYKCWKGDNQNQQWKFVPYCKSF